LYATTGFPTTVRDIVTVIARIGLGAIFIAHGWQKFNEWTIAGTTESFSQMGVPTPEIAAPFATFVELIGGALLIGVLLAANMIGALVIAHLTAVPFVDQGGWELVAALAAGALLLAAMGPGRWSVDRLLFAGKKTKAGRSAATRSTAARSAAEV